jgi:putative FmdB family regulatory protein
MPLYEFECKKCKHKYEELAKFDPEGKYKGVACPECNSKSKKRLHSACTCTFTNPVGTDKYENSHDYRYHHNLNKSGGVKQTRKLVEQASHVGPTPYPDIDDVSSGKHFGEVK